MITSIEIQNLRGIREGELSGLAPLTVLTGPNGCGKSTVLDALLIGATAEPGKDVGRAVARHPEMIGGSRWLFRDRLEKARLILSMAAGATWTRNLEWIEGCDEIARDRLQKRLDQQARPPFSMVRCVPVGGGISLTAFDMGNRYADRSSAKAPEESVPVRLVDPGRPVPLHRLFAEVARTERRDAVYDLLRDLVEGFEQLEILVEADDSPILHLRRAGGTVPVSLSGDGVQGFVRLALEIAAAPEGLVLLEDPEVYQHPRAIWQTARALLANVRRGVQIVLTTHSLELIDALLAEATAEDLESTALLNLALENGELRSVRHGGEEIAFARQELENDLR